MRTRTRRRAPSFGLVEFSALPFQWLSCGEMKRRIKQYEK
jgi:hypothetical protein